MSNISKKRIAAGALIFNENNELLIVKPSYKNYWSIPGGMVEQNESPSKACVREVEEEVSIKINNPKFLCVDYMSVTDNKDESLQFIFYGGRLDAKQAANIKVDADEIVDYGFVSIEEAINLFGGEKRGLARRLPKCLEVIKSETPIYLENAK